MYKYNLVISIFSTDEKIKQIVENINPLEHFSHDVKIYDNFDYNIASNSDVLILDLNDEEILEIIKTNNFKAKIILLVDQYKKEFDKVDSIIIRPSDYEMIRYNVSKILDKISLEDELDYTKICLNTTIDNIPDMIWIKSLDGIHTLLNKEFCNVVNKEKDDIIGKDHYYIWDVSKDDPNSGADICKKTEDDVIEVGHTLKFNECVKNQDGIRQLVTYKSPLYDKIGNVIGTVGFGHDITDLKNLSVENEILLNSVPYAVLLKDNDEKIQIVNNYFETHFNIAKEDIIGTSYNDWVAKTFQDEREINEGGYVERKTCGPNKDVKIFELRFDDVSDIFNNITGQVCIFRDVTIERNLESQIIKSSNVDFLTNLYNRRYLDNFVSKLGEDVSISLLSIDLDHFKNVNDTFGHKAGDEALILSADTIRECFPNDLVVRMGGDEFLVVKVGEFTLEKIKNEAQNLLDTLNKNFLDSKRFSIITASVGIVQGTLKDGGFYHLLQCSDDALYKAKESGRACYYVHGKKD